MDEDTEYLKLSIEDRVSHKLWKARVSGYEEATKLFNSLEGDDEKFKRYIGLIKKFVTDSNVVAQEKGLTAACAFVQNANSAGKTTSEVIDGIVNKCLGASKAKTKELALEISLIYCEIEFHEKVIEELLKGTSQKNPKVVANVIWTINVILRAFGAKVIKVSPILKASIPLLDHRDKSVRDECKKLVVEAYRWVGPIMKSQLTGCKAVQLTELETEFDKLTDAGHAKPERYLRSQQKKIGIGNDEDDVDALGGEENEEEIEESPLDPYDLIDPVDILSKLPKNFYELLEESKWQLRKEALSSLLPLSQMPKIANGDFGDLIRSLKKVIGKDSNVILVALACQCSTGLARGLRSGFKMGANSLLPVALEKFKEKKANVVTALVELVDAFYSILGIEAIQEDVLVALKHKTPSVNSETAKYLSRCFVQCPMILTNNKKVLKGYVSILLEKLCASESFVRDAASEALGTLMKFIGETSLLKLMPDVDNIKLSKIKEYADKVELSGKVIKKKLVTQSNSSKPLLHSSKGKTLKVSDTFSKHHPASGAAPHLPTHASKVTKNSKKANNNNTTTINSLTSEPELSPEEVIELSSQLFSESVVSNLSDGNWKTRLGATEEIMNVLNTSSSPPHALLVIKMLVVKPGLKDNNFQVLAQKINAIRIAAEKGTFSEQCWNCIMPELLEKFSDQKNTGLIKETLFVIAEKTNLFFVFNGVFEHGMSSKSPKVKAETFAWASEALILFGLSGINPALALESIKKGLVENNPVVRTNAIHLLGVLHWFVGPNVRRIFEDEKASVLSIIDVEIGKYAGKPLPLSSRGKISLTNSDCVNGNLPMEEEDKEVVDIIPRTDISSQITEALLDKMSNKNWKIRKEGMDELKDILNSAKFIASNVGNLPSALSSRFTDTNKIICVQSIEIAKDLFLAMGPHIKTYIPTFLPGLLNSLSDSKQNVRVSVLSAMETLLIQSTLKDFFTNEMFATALAKGNPFVKQEIFGFLASKLMEAKTVPKDDLAAILPSLLANLEDRSAEVRKNAVESLPGVMRHLGYNRMKTASDKLKPSSKAAITSLLDKARESLPVVKTLVAPPVRKPSNSNSSNKIPSSSIDGKKPSSNAKSRLALVSQAAVNRKKADDSPDGPPYTSSNLKNIRFKDEIKLKTLKWNFSSPRQEFLDQLKEQMTAANFSKSLMIQMFHTDFKQHLKVIEVLSRHLESDVEGLIANLDLILKWLTLRFFETSPSVLLKGLEYLHSVFTVLSEDSYVLHDIEANSFIPYLVGKVGDPKDQVRSSVRSIFKNITQIYAANKFVVFLMNGLSSKNSKQRAEILEELGSLIKGYGTSILQPSPPVCLKEIARQISDRDSSARVAALNTITEAFFQDGEKLYKILGNIPEKDMAMLEERIKRTSKNRSIVTPPSALPPPPPSLSSKSNKCTDVNLPKKSSSSTSPARPLSGVFHLNYDEIETDSSDARMSESGPRLLTHNLDDIFNDEPVVLPQTYTSSRLYSSPWNESAEAFEALDGTIAQIYSTETKTSISALLQLDELIKDADKVRLLIKRLDQLFSACTTKYKYVLFSMLQTTDNVNQKDVIKLFQHNTMVLMSLYHHGDITAKASLNSLYDLTRMIISILIETSIQDLHGGGQLIRALNVLTVKIVDRSDHTNVSCAFLKLLRESVEIKTNSKFLELVMKCLWKIIRFIDSTEEWIQDLNLSLLLVEIHEFLKIYPNSYWKQQEVDTPLRTVKTFIHVCVKKRGSDLLNHLNKIADCHQSELLPYIRKLLNNESSGENSSSAAAANNNNNNHHHQHHHDSKMKTIIKVPRFSKNDHETLAYIFKKIGQKDDTKQGLEELYNFKIQNPDADIEPFLSKSSQYFRDYIERGLKNIEKEVVSGNVGGKPLTTVSNDNNESCSGSSHAFFLDRLKRLRKAGGLDNADIGQENMVARPIYNEERNLMYQKQDLRIFANRKIDSPIINRNHLEPPQLEDIRKRLEKVKHGAY